MPRDLRLAGVLVVMAKNVTLSDEAYKFLKSIKEDRSFSDVILSFKTRQGDLESYAGSIDRSSLETVEKMREEMREDWSDRDDRR
jgi:predicted CopG family antitoxin